MRAAIALVAESIGVVMLVLLLDHGSGASPWVRFGVGLATAVVGLTLFVYLDRPGGRR